MDHQCSPSSSASSSSTGSTPLCPVEKSAGRAHRSAVEEGPENMKDICGDTHIRVCQIEASLADLLNIVKKISIAVYQERPQQDTIPCQNCGVPQLVRYYDEHVSLCQPSGTQQQPLQETISCDNCGIPQLVKYYDLHLRHCQHTGTQQQPLPDTIPCQNCGIPQLVKYYDQHLSLCQPSTNDPPCCNKTLDKIDPIICVTKHLGPPPYRTLPSQKNDGNDGPLQGENPPPYTRDPPVPFPAGHAPADSPASPAVGPLAVTLTHVVAPHTATNVAVSAAPAVAPVPAPVVAPDSPADTEVSVAAPTPVIVAPAPIPAESLVSATPSPGHGASTATHAVSPAADAALVTDAPAVTCAAGTSAYPPARTARTATASAVFTAVGDTPHVPAAAFPPSGSAPAAPTVEVIVPALDVAAAATGETGQPNDGHVSDNDFPVVTVVPAEDNTEGHGNAVADGPSSSATIEHTARVTETPGATAVECRAAIDTDEPAVTATGHCATGAVTVPAVVTAAESDAYWHGRGSRSHPLNHAAPQLCRLSTQVDDPVSPAQCSQEHSAYEPQGIHQQDHRPHLVSSPKPAYGVSACPFPGFSYQEGYVADITDMERADVILNTPDFDIADCVDRDSLVTPVLVYRCRDEGRDAQIYRDIFRRHEGPLCVALNVIPILVDLQAESAITPLLLQDVLAMRTPIRRVKHFIQEYIFSCPDGVLCKLVEECFPRDWSYFVQKAEGNVRVQCAVCRTFQECTGLSCPCGEDLHGLSPKRYQPIKGSGSGSEDGDVDATHSSAPQDQQAPSVNAVAEVTSSDASNTTDENNILGLQANCPVPPPEKNEMDLDVEAHARVYSGVSVVLVLPPESMTGGATADGSGASTAPESVTVNPQNSIAETSDGVNVSTLPENAVTAASYSAGGTVAEARCCAAPYQGSDLQGAAGTETAAAALPCAGHAPDLAILTCGASKKGNGDSRIGFTTDRTTHVSPPFLHGDMSLGGYREAEAMETLPSQLHHHSDSGAISEEEDCCDPAQPAD